MTSDEARKELQVGDLTVERVIGLLELLLSYRAG